MARRRAKGQWKTNVDFSISDLIQGLAYAGGRGSTSASQEMTMINSLNRGVDGIIVGLPNETNIAQLNMMDKELDARYGPDSGSSINKYPEAQQNYNFQKQAIQDRISRVNSYTHQRNNFFAKDDTAVDLWKNYINTTENFGYDSDEAQIAAEDTMTFLKGYVKQSIEFNDEYSDFFDLPSHKDDQLTFAKINDTMAFELQQLTGIKTKLPYWTERPTMHGMLEAITAAHETNDNTPINDWEKKASTIDVAGINEKMSKIYDAKTKYDFAYRLINGDIIPEERVVFDARGEPILDEFGNQIMEKYWTDFGVKEDGSLVKQEITENDIDTIYMPELRKLHGFLAYQQKDLSNNHNVTLNVLKPFAEPFADPRLGGETEVDDALEEKYHFTKKGTYKETSDTTEGILEYEEQPAAYTLDPSILSVRDGTQRFSFVRGEFDEYNQFRNVEYKTTHQQKGDVDQSWFAHLKVMKGTFDNLDAVARSYDTGFNPETNMREHVASLKKELERRKNKYLKLINDQELFDKEKVKWWDKLSKRDKQRILKIKDAENMVLRRRKAIREQYDPTAGRAGGVGAPPTKELYEELRPGDPLTKYYEGEPPETFDPWAEPNVQEISDIIDRLKKE